MAQGPVFWGHCEEHSDEAISLLRHESDCFPFAAAQGFGFCATQKLGSIDCHSERSEESRPTWEEMLHSAQHDIMPGSALRNDAAASLRASGQAIGDSQ